MDTDPFAVHFFRWVSQNFLERACCLESDDRAALVMGDFYLYNFSILTKEFAQIKLISGWQEAVDD